MKEIGGYMELEHFVGEEYYPDLFKINLGRTALVFLLQRLSCRRVYIPRYICDSVIHSAEQAGFEVVLYPTGEDLMPVLSPDTPDPAQDWVYIVNYYGQLTEDQIRMLDEKYHHRTILDNAQAFYQKPVGDIHTIYTARKFLGLSDGAYIHSASCDGAELPRDHSAGRMKHILGRLEENARNHYSEMLAVSDTFADALPLSMSALTENLLRAVDYESVKEKRCENYRTLQKLLPSDNPFTRREPIAPFAYPFYHPDGVALRKALAAENIFVPTNWSYLLKICSEGSLEYDWSANILPLPIDQRYSEAEMKTIAEAIHRFSR